MDDFYAIENLKVTNHEKINISAMEESTINASKGFLQNYRDGTLGHTT